MRITGLLAIGFLAAVTVGSAQAAPNLITNGDFSAGNAGFTSAYTYETPASNVLVPEGTYTVTGDPHSVHDSWITLSGGNELIVNGATSGQPTIWEEDGISGAGSYHFSAAVTNICCNISYTGDNEPSQIIFQFSTDSGATWHDITNQLTNPPSDAGNPYALAANFTTTGTFDIRAVNGLTAAGGNDFAIDDIVVTSAVPEPAAWAMLLIGFFGVGAATRALRSRGALNAA
jgi:hypothetical protein